MTTEPQEQTGYRQVADIDNVLWNVYQTRATKHGFDLFFGDRADTFCFPGQPSLIVTPELRAFLDPNTTADKKVLLDLPLAPSTIDRIRTRLGFHSPQRRHPKNWWRKPELLAILTSGVSERLMAEKLGISPTYAGQLRRKACLMQRIPLRVRKKVVRRPPNWWQQPEPLSILDSELPERQIGEKLGISPGYAGRLRKQACLLLNKTIHLATPRTYRPRNWWRQPEVLEILTSALPGNQIPPKLGISATHVSRLRQKARALMSQSQEPQAA